MKILFLIPYPDKENNNNLYRKFSSQITSAKKLGGRVFYTSYDEKNIYINEVANEAYKQRIGSKIPHSQNFTRMHFIMYAVRRWLKKENVDMVYMRTITPSSTYRKTFDILKKKNVPLVVEIPTYPGTQEAKNSSRKVFFLLVSLFKKLFKGAYRDRVSLYTLIGEKADAYKNTPAINIENGLDVETIPIKKGFEKHDGEMHLLVAAYFSYWHGYDRLIDGIVDYYRSPGVKTKVVVHICGKPADDSLGKMLNIVKENGLEQYVIYHGYLSGKTLDEMYDKCDVAIGSLGLHRQNIIVDTTLKLPEYTARAIPFVFCTDSNNVDETGRYYLKLESGEAAIDIMKIIKFFDSIDKTEVQKELRTYAEKALGWDVQFKKVVDFFDKGRC